MLISRNDSGHSGAINIQVCVHLQCQFFFQHFYLQLHFIFSYLRCLNVDKHANQLFNDKSK